MADTRVHVEDGEICLWMEDYGEYAVLSPEEARDLAADLMQAAGATTDPALRSTQAEQGLSSSSSSSSSAGAGAGAGATSD